MCYNENYQILTLLNCVHHTLKTPISVLLIQLLFRTLFTSFYKFICINMNDNICHIKHHINNDSLGGVRTLVNLNGNYNAF
jgi:hypothetical protein